MNDQIISSKKFTAQITSRFMYILLPVTILIGTIYLLNKNTIFFGSSTHKENFQGPHEGIDIKDNVAGKESNPAYNVSYVRATGPTIHVTSDVPYGNPTQVAFDVVYQNPNQNAFFIILENPNGNIQPMIRGMISCIGEITRGRGIQMKFLDGKTRRIKPQGYEHLKP